MLGYSEKDVGKFVHFKAFTELLHPEDYERAMKAMQDHIDGKTDLYQLNYRIKTKTGKFILLHDRGQIVGRKGDELAVAGIVLNITNNNY